jgi:hypothetical protein
MRGWRLTFTVSTLILLLVFVSDEIFSNSSLQVKMHEFVKGNFLPNSRSRIRPSLVPDEVLPCLLQTYGNILTVDNEYSNRSKFLELFREQSENPIEHALIKMCGVHQIFNAEQVKAAFLNSPVVIVGLEAWTSGSLREVHVTYGNTSSSEYLIQLQALPHFDQNFYDVLGEPFENDADRSWPIFYLARNPTNTDLEIRMLNRIFWMHVSGYQFVHFGGFDDIVARQDWIRKFVSKDHDFAGEHDPHDFATLTAFQFLENLANSNLSHAVYMETDAVPVFNFGRKFSSFLRQLHFTLPLFDLALLGTCLGLEQKASAGQAVASNVHLMAGTRCFNAVLISRSTARRILAYGALGKEDIPDYSIDHAFNHYIRVLSLTTVWASAPLFHEESKSSTQFMC